MGTTANVSLTPGTVFRTAALRRWGDNPTRLAQRLEREGRVQRLGHGFLYVPRETKFGLAPPSEEALLDALLDGTTPPDVPSLIIAAEGEYQASTRLAEAAAVIGREPGAMQLRYLQTLSEIATENNSTTIFPVPIELLSAFLPMVKKALKE